MADFGVLLLGFGGPDSRDAVKPFLENIFGDKERAEKAAADTVDRYKKIGGWSPLLGITKKQAHALETKLNQEEQKYRVYIGMHYWHPFLNEVVDEIIKDEIHYLTVLSLSPFYSKVTTGSHFKELKTLLVEKGSGFKTTFVQSWHDNPFYLDALSEKIQKGLLSFRKPDTQNIQVVFSAHSLPKKVMESGDPYVNQLRESIKEVIKRFRQVPWNLSFQSGGKQGEWLEPTTEEVLKNLAEEGFKAVLIVPISFISDHLEVLYDIDIAYCDLVESLGMSMRRTESLNDSPGLISAMADVVLKFSSNLR